jgi:Interferon-induced transmembrane protein/zinc-ribbon domain
LKNCPNCGTSNLETASICANCGKPLAGGAPHSYTPPPPSTPSSFASSAAPAETIPNYLIQSIIVTLCCCLPLGVVAIIFSAQVNSKLAAGDIAGARDASAKAKMFCWIAFGIGIALILLSFLTSGTAILQGIRDGMANR